MSARPSAARVSRATAISRALSRAPGTRSRAAARAAAGASPLCTEACSAARRAARRSASRSLIKVDLQREGRPGIAGHELVVRLRHRPGELAVLQQLERERGDAVALRRALVRAVREHDRGVSAGCLCREQVADLVRDALLLSAGSRGVIREELESTHLDTQHDRRRVDARWTRRLDRRSDRVRREEDREHAEEQVGPQPTREVERDAAMRGALHALPPRDRVGRALEADRRVTESLDDALEVEELALALDRALVDAPLLGGHVGKDRLRVTGAEVERAER